MNMLKVFRYKSKEQQAIYRLIKDNLDENSYLPSGFILPDDTPENQIKFVPGAMDGICVYHMASADANNAAANLFKLIRRYSENSNLKNKKKISEFLNENNLISIIDPLLRNIQGNHSEMNPQAIFNIALDFMTNSTDKESVKLGIALAGLLGVDENNEGYKVVFTLGKYDEFSLYSIVTLSNWNGGNQFIFALAKELCGWGKIHAVERLEAQTQEIKDWIIKYGCNNMVMPAYLGLTCAQKGDLISYLRQEMLDKETFTGASVIIDALLDEGPVQGISEYEHAEEAISLYLKHAKNLCKSLEDLFVILNVKYWLKNREDNNSRLLDLCDAIINNPEWKNLILKTLNDYDAQSIFYVCNIAQRLGIDISESLFNLIENNPLEYSGYISGLYKSSEYAAKVTALYEKGLPLDSIASGMGNLLGLGPEFKAHGCLDFLLQELKEYPGMGRSLVMVALNSPVIRNRNGACNVLEAWKEKGDTSLSQVDSELVYIIKRILAVEIDDELKERYEKILQ